MLRRTGLSGWRRHARLLGRPDFSWPRERVAVFVDGCFWHGHDCGRNVTPKTNAEAWREKLEGNRARDRKVARVLRRKGWKVIRVWECELAKHEEACLLRIQRAVRKPVS